MTSKFGQQSSDIEKVPAVELERRPPPISNPTYRKHPFRTKIREGRSLLDPTGTASTRPPHRGAHFGSLIDTNASGPRYPKLTHPEQTDGSSQFFTVGTVGAGSTPKRKTAVDSSDPQPQGLVDAPRARPNIARWLAEVQNSGSLKGPEELDLLIDD